MIVKASVKRTVTDPAVNDDGSRANGEIADEPHNCKVLLTRNGFHHYHYWGIFLVDEKPLLGSRLTH